METINVNQLTSGEGGIYLLAETPFSGFAIETFPDGRLLTQMSLMHGRLDGVTRRWHPNGQLESEKGYRNGVLRVEKQWQAGERRRERYWDEQARLVQETHFHNPADTVRYQVYEMNDDGKLVKVKTEETKRPDSGGEPQGAGDGNPDGDK